jgi:hypothetical protein
MCFSPVVHKIGQIMMRTYDAHLIGDAVQQARCVVNVVLTAYCAMKYNNEGETRASRGHSWGALRTTYMLGFLSILKLS